MQRTVTDCSETRNRRLAAKRTALERDANPLRYEELADVRRKQAITLYQYVDLEDARLLWISPELVAPFAFALAYADTSTGRRREPLSTATTRLPARQWDKLARVRLAYRHGDYWRLRRRDGKDAGWLTTDEWGKAGQRETMPPRAWLILAMSRMIGSYAPAVIEALTGDHLDGARARDLRVALATSFWPLAAVSPRVTVRHGEPIPDNAEHGGAFLLAQRRRASATSAARQRWRGHESAEVARPWERDKISRSQWYRRRQKHRDATMPADADATMPADMQCDYASGADATMPADMPLLPTPSKVCATCGAEQETDCSLAVDDKRLCGLSRCSTP